MKNSHTKHTKHSRGNKRAKEEQLRIMNDILSLSDTHNDTEIMTTLKIPNETFYRYKNALNEKVKEGWKQTIKDSVELRIIHTVNAINLALKTSKEIATDTNNSPRDRLDAADRFVQTEQDFLELLRSLRDGDDNIAEEQQQEETKPYPTITDPNWIKENIRKMKEQSKLKDIPDYGV
jgi:hypothetical protein